MGECFENLFLFYSSTYTHNFWVKNKNKNLNCPTLSQVYVFVDIKFATIGQVGEARHQSKEIEFVHNLFLLNGSQPQTLKMSDESYFQPRGHPLMLREITGVDLRPLSLAMCI